jgi:PAS domain S-box-containing protein
MSLMLATNPDSAFGEREEAFFTSTLSGEILHWDAAAERVYGYKAKEVIGKVPQIVPPHKAEENQWLLSQVSQGQVLPHIETERLRKNGELIHVLLTLLPLRDASGKVTGVTGITTDITEKKKLEQELYQRNKELSALEAITDEINKTLDLNEVLKKIVDLAGGLVNARYTSILLVDEQGRFKTSAENFQGIRPLHLRARRSGVIEQILATGKPVVVDEVKGEREINSALITVGIKSCLGVPIKLDDEILGVLFAYSDMPKTFSARHVNLMDTFAGQAATAIQNARLYQDLKTQMKNLQDTQAQLTQAAKLAAIGRLAANMAHEINNPLTGILMASSVLDEQANKSDPRKQELQTITREALRARGIIRNLLDFARQSQAKVVEVDINELLQSSVSLLRHVMDMKGVEFVEHYSSEVLKVSVDRNQMMQVFYNLVTNALDAMPQGGKLTLATKAKEDYVLIEFTDTGVGISPKDMDRIFEPFFTTKLEAKGTGLGLSVSYNIVTAARGIIQVKSKPGKGSTFMVSLPIVKRAHEEES